jgi:DNA-binding NtrC family response regulator
MSYSILIAEDDDSLRRVAEYNLREEGYTVSVAGDGEEAARLFSQAPPDLLLTDLRMPGREGLDLLRQVRESGAETEVILVTAFGTVDDAVRAMKDGAFDFITKPVRWEELRHTVARALERLRLRRETTRLHRELGDRFHPERITGVSAAMNGVRESILRVADSPAPVLILGESGTGKELVARALHYQSLRGDFPFVAVNCAALPRDLIEAELLGVRKGAYTGAERDRNGRFVEADRGSLFLDEIGELEPDLQVKLLRVLEEKRVTPLGGGTPVEVDVRILAATNRPVEEALAAGRLRQDLYYRLNVVAIHVPALRERPADIPPLVQHFLERLGAPQVHVTEEATAILCAHSWPGNVRELGNAIERALLFRRDPDRITPEDLPAHLHQGRTAEAGAMAGAGVGVESAPVGPFILPPTGLNLYELERDLILQALHRAGGNQTQAAQFLGMTRQTLVYRMQKYGIRSKTRA